MKKNKFLHGVVMLSIFGFVSKILGAVYRIPLTHLLSSEGMGLYQMVFPLYSLLIALSSSGFPASISKLVAEYNARGEYRQSKKILFLSLSLLMLFSIICALFLILYSSQIAELQGNSGIRMLYITIAPAIVLVGMIAGFKGYFQGCQNMTPSSITLLIEQLTKLVLGLLLAKLLIKYGIEYAALGAIIGVVLSEGLSLLFLLLYFLVSNKKRKKLVNYDYINTNKFYIRRILSLSLPVTLGALIMPACMFVDSALIVNLLQNVGYSQTEATSLFGLSSGVVGAIVNMPVVFAVAIGTAIVPLASKNQACNNHQKMQEHISLSLVLNFVIILPCAIILFVFSDMIIDFLYGASLTLTQLSTSSLLLKFGAFGSIFLSLVQISASFLQGLGKNLIPALSLLFGAIIKIVLTVFLVERGVSIFAAEIASSVCYGVTSIINLLVILSKYKFVMRGELIKILLSCVLIFAASIISKKVILSFANGKIALILSLIAVFVVAMIIYYMMYKKNIDTFLQKHGKKHQKAVE